MNNIDKLRLVKIPSHWKVKDHYTYASPRLIGENETIEVVELMIGESYGYVRFKDVFGYLNTYDADKFFKVFESEVDEE